MATEMGVKRANKQFYDIIAEDYECVDVRRSNVTLQWLESRMEQLSKKGNARLLDIGCGNGFVIRAGKKHFGKLFGTDISHKVLTPIRNNCSGVVCSDVFKLPFKDNSFDVVSCFAVLHHCFNHEGLVKEVFRVLKKGGVFYSDHDLDKEFMRNFYLPMKAYRFFFDFEQKYLEKNKQITKELYDLTEFHSEGVNSVGILKLLRKTGFEKVVPRYHWFGIKDFLTLLLCRLHITNFPRGLAPLFSVTAIK